MQSSQRKGDLISAAGIEVLNGQVTDSEFTWEVAAAIFLYLAHRKGPAPDLAVKVCVNQAVYELLLRIVNSFYGLTGSKAETYEMLLQLAVELKTVCVEELERDMRRHAPYLRSSL